MIRYDMLPEHMRDAARAYVERGEARHAPACATTCRYY